MNIITYTARMFRQKAFWKNPLTYVSRGLVWLLHLALGRKAKFNLRKFGFVFEVVPKLKHYGSTGVYLQREYYEPAFEHLEKLVHPGETFIDCGANQGIYTCAAASIVKSSGMVIAVEPQEYAYRALVNNAEINRFEHVKPECCAISSEDGETYLNTGVGATSASIIGTDTANKKLLVPTRTIDSLLREYDATRCDCIKLDVEGAELLALQGARETVQKYGPTFILEILKPESPDATKLLNTLRDFSYKFWNFDSTGDLRQLQEIIEPQPTLVAKRPAQ